MLVLNYTFMEPGTPEEQDRPSVGSLFLRRATARTDVEDYAGYWIGRDPDVEEIVACPYVLSRGLQPREIKREYKEWLEQECVSFSTAIGLQPSQPLTSDSED